MGGISAQVFNYISVVRAQPAHSWHGEAAGSEDDEARQSARFARNHAARYYAP
jgi:hypothetical protein